MKPWKNHASTQISTQAPGPEDDPCWCLKFGSPLRPLDEFETALNLSEGMPVVLYYRDESEEFEVSAVLSKSVAGGPLWRACADWNTMRRIR
jgi:hypothetical protein